MPEYKKAVRKEIGRLLPGSIIISKASGGIADRGQPIHISIEDESSGCLILEMYMALDEFATALTCSYGKATIRHFDSPNIGKKSENKTVNVPYAGREEDDITKALAPFEVDGWKARRSDMTNGHRRSGDEQAVVFFRYV